jgi:hypothetical protein
LRRLCPNPLGLYTLRSSDTKISQIVYFLSFKDFVMASFRQFAVVAVLSPFFCVQARADIYRCESETGVPLYQNTPAKNCKKLDLTPASTIPTPKANVVRSNTRPDGKPNSGDFPKVESSAQGARDSDRRRILDEELKKEETRLSELKKEFNGGEVERRADERNFDKYQTRVQKLKDDIGRAESNVGSLRRELDLTKN